MLPQRICSEITLIAWLCMLPSLIQEDVNFNDFEVVPDSEIVQRIDSFIEAGMKCHNNPGLTVSVVRGDEILMAKGYGFKTVEKLDPVTNSTLFGMASLSKAFAATLILKLIETSKMNISLSSTVASILNDDKLFYDELRSKHATLEDLLAHRMGIPPNNNIRLDDNLTRKSLAKRLSFLKATGEFRNSYYYSNLMYGLATYIGEVLGDKSWEDLVQSEILRPLGMNSTTFVTSANPNDLDLAQGYVEADGQLIPVDFELSRRWGLLCGSGCVLSNALDMANWMMFHLNEGRNRNEQQVVKDTSLIEMFKSQNSWSSSYAEKFYSKPITPVTLSFSNYGLGWKLGHYRGYPVISHSGSTFGYRALLTLIPRYDIGIFVALTGDDPSILFRTNIHLYISDLLLGYNPWLNTSTLCTFPHPWATSDTNRQPTEQRKNLTAYRSLEKYVGIYTNSAYGVLNITWNGTSNALKMHYGYGIFLLHPKTDKDEFYGEGTGIWESFKRFGTLRFESDETDSAIVSLAAPSFEPKLPPVFWKDGFFPKKKTTTNKTNGCNRVLKRPTILLNLVFSFSILFTQVKY